MNDDHEFPQRLSLEQAAEILGSTPLNVLLHIKRGLLVGEVPEGVWMVDPDSLAELLRKRKEGAVPMVCQSGCGKPSGSCGNCG